MTINEVYKYIQENFKDLYWEELRDFYRDVREEFKDDEDIDINSRRMLEIAKKYIAAIENRSDFKLQAEIKWLNQTIKNLEKDIENLRWDKQVCNVQMETYKKVIDRFIDKLMGD